MAQMLIDFIIKYSFIYICIIIFFIHVIPFLNYIIIQFGKFQAITVRGETAILNKILNNVLWLDMEVILRVRIFRNTCIFKSSKHE